MSREQMKARLEAATPGPWHPHDIAEVDQPRNHIHPDRPWWWVWQTSKLPYYGGVLKVEDYGEGKDGAIGEVTSGGDRDIPQQWADAQFIAHAPTDLAKLHAALDAVEALHKPEKRWEPYAEAGYSFLTREQALEAAGEEDLGAVAMEAGPQFFEVCKECARVESEQLDEIGEEWGYRESLWPCPTFTAIRDALGEEDR